MAVILYTTHCPKCNVLEKKLISKNIQYSLVEDVNLMISKGFDVMPMLDVNGNIMDFKAANTWINEQ